MVPTRTDSMEIGDEMVIESESNESNIDMEESDEDDLTPHTRVKLYHLTAEGDWLDQVR